MTETTSDKQKNNIFFKLALTIILLVGGVTILGWEKTVNIIIVLVGFGAVIFVHELGHYLAARAVGIKIEAFSLGFGPVFIGLTRAAGRWHTRILPDFSHKDDPAARQADGTEYRLSLIPLGGYVKMMGQEDLAADKPSDDPRSFVNKTVLQRMFVISAGVIMNLICGAFVFMLVFAHGFETTPAVTGIIMKDSPAQKAGMRPGGEILAIDGKRRITFSDIQIAGAFTRPGEMRELEVHYPDGSTETHNITVSEDRNALGLHYFGIDIPMSLVIPNEVEEVSKEEFVEELRKDGLEPGWSVTAVNGRPISRYSQLYDVIHPELADGSAQEVTLTIAKDESSDQVKNISVALKLDSISTEGHVFGLTPRLKITSVSKGSSAEKAGLKKNDIVLAVGNVANPTFEDLRQQCRENADKPMKIQVLRGADETEEDLVFTVTPKRATLWWLKQIFLSETQRELYLSPIIGVYPAQDMDHPIMAKAVAPMSEVEPLKIPRGAKIVSVAGQQVNNYEDIFTALRDHRGSEVNIVYAVDGGEGQVAAKVPQDIKWTSGVVWKLDWQNKYDLPLLTLKKTIKGDGMLDSLAWGYETSVGFVAQTYAFIRGMMTRQVSASAASGPVGILSMSYTIASEQSFNKFFYFMAMISVCVAVFNFLPLPVLDGGYVVMLIIEKIKGSPVSMKVQEFITYSGLAVLLLFVIYVTRNDIGRLITGGY
ncbi:MAG: site-2 protease family protein [Sedimentisphaerales bacterium]|nr:site-2 protease family protein [Sedimentisphaerales bacterium]